MPDAVMLAGALACSIIGMAWLALAMEVHWQQLRADRSLTNTARVVLRSLGGAALLASLAICLAVDHISMASLVWVMTLAASALIVSFTLTWRPHWFAPLLLRSR